MSEATAPATGITITCLRINGSGKRPAEVSFSKGLNVISGASDTGKTHILQCLEYMLGGSTSPKRFPQNEPYTDIYLSLKARTHPEITLRRAFSGGKTDVFDGGFATAKHGTPSRILANKHNPNKNETVSALLLNYTGFARKRILAKKTDGTTRELSFRKLAALCVIPETAMLSEGSPIHTDIAPETTPDESTFELMITGRDSSAVVAIPDKKIQKARLEGQLEFVDKFIAQREQELLRTRIDTAGVSERLQQIEASIQQATQSSTGIQQELLAHEDLQAETWKELKIKESRLAVINELLGRFSLLAKHYDLDIERLAAMIEAVDAFATLEPVTCPWCGSEFSETQSPAAPEEAIQTFGKACRIEISKIKTLTEDLTATQSRLMLEKDSLVQTRDSQREKFERSVAYVQETLQPRYSSMHSGLLQQAKMRDALAVVHRIVEELTGLSSQRSDVMAALKAKPQKSTAKIDLSAGSISSLCSIIQILLQAWKYPQPAEVSFDEKEMDFIVAGQLRSSHGKGYRAFIHAAFAIGLMQYCRSVGLPHPGFVILDSPLVTLREADSGLGETISTEMRDAFYGDLADALGEDQVIVLENDGPPLEVQSRINFIHFSRKVEVGRYGFYPVAAP